MPMAQGKQPEFPAATPVFGEVIDQSTPYCATYLNSTNLELIQRGPVWTTTQTWSNESVSHYRKAAATAAAIAPGANKQSEFSCEDFLLAFLLEFAMMHGLPVHITNGANPMGFSNEDNQGTFDLHDFRREILKSTGASDLDRLENAMSPFYQCGRGILEQLRQAQPGDLFLCDLNGNGHSSHAQLVTSVDEDIVTITQGNLDGDAGFCLGNVNNPDSSCYLGEPLEEVTYQKENGQYRSNYSFQNLKVQVSLWNFEHWNHMAKITREAVNECRQAKKHYVPFTITPGHPMNY